MTNQLTPEALDALLAEHYRRDCMTCDGYCDSCGHTSGRWPDPEWPCQFYLLASEVRDARAFWDAMRECREWAAQQFPNSRPEGKAKHLAKEAYELAADPMNTEEMADVLMIFAHLADWEGVDLAAALRSKLAINRGRTWGAPDADGVIEHVRVMEEQR